MATRTIHTEIEIEATPSEVWAVLTDWPGHDEWNPFMKRVSGELRVGSILRFRAYVAGRAIPIASPLSSVIHDKELVWSGPDSGIQSRIFRGRHWVRLEATETGTRMYHGEDFGGAIPRLLWFMLEGLLLPSYLGMNEGLKRAVEGR